MKIPLILCSHAILGLAAWGIAREFRPSVPPAQTDHPTLSTKRTREPGPASPEPAVRDNILSTLPGLTLPPDPAASIRRHLSATDEPTSAQAAALLLLWCRSSPDEALRFVFDADNLKTMPGADEALELIGESVSPDILMNLPGGQRRDPIFDGLARQLIARHNVVELADLLKGLDRDLQSSVTYHIGKQWPPDRLDDYGRLATAMGDIDMLDRIGDHLPREEAAKWMIRYINENPDPEFANRIRASMTYFALMRDQPHLPLEERLAGLSHRPANEGRPAEIVRSRSLEILADNDVRKFLLGDGPDLRHAFHHRKIEAADILTQLTNHLPEYETTGKLPEILYSLLAPEDPERAASLIAGLPVGRQAELMAKVFESGCSLDILGRTLAAFPVSDDKEVLDARREIWKKATDRSLTRYGKDYIRWISGLPDPLDRRLALGAIAYSIDGAANDEANEIREIVGDIPLGEKR